MHMSKWLGTAIVSGALALSAVAQAASSPELQKQVADTERAFAATMKARDHAAFASFLSDETVFFSPKATHGKAAVAAEWKKFYEGPNPPFSWEPDTVEVLASGTLAISSGPVAGPDGVVRSRFTSIWRLENGKWKIIFDKGNPVCQPCEKK
jgi:ketosteroid isomerase-like protein